MKTEKKCTMCKEVKTLDHFRRDHTREDGFHPYCKECQREIRKRARNTEGNAFREGEKRRHKEYELRKRNRIYESLTPLQKASFYLKKYHKELKDKVLKELENGNS